MSGNPRSESGAGDLDGTRLKGRISDRVEPAQRSTAVGTGAAKRRFVATLADTDAYVPVATQPLFCRALTPVSVSRGPPRATLPYSE